MFDLGVRTSRSCIPDTVTGELFKVGFFPPEKTCQNASLVRTPGCEIPGYSAELLGAILSHLRMCYTIVALDPDVTSYGEKIPGGWSGALGLILNGTIDTVADAYGFHLDRLANFTFATAIGEFPYGFIVRKPEPKGWSVSLSLVDIFSSSVWISLLCVILTAFLLSLWDFRFRKRRWPTGFDVLQLAWWMFALKGRNMHASRNSHGMRLVGLCYGVMLLLFLPLFRCLILGKLLIPPTRMPFHTTAELAKLIAAKKMQLVATFPKELYVSEIRTSFSEPFKSLNKSLQNNKLLIKMNSTRLFDEEMRTNDYAVISGKEYAMEEIAERCHLTFIQDNIVPTVWGSFLFRNGFNFSRIDFELKHSKYAIRMLERKYFGLPPRQRCLLSMTQNGPNQIKISHIWLLFSIFATIATVVGLVGCVLEKCST